MTDSHYIINQTNKQIVHQLNLDIWSVEQDSLMYYANGFCDTTLEWKFSEITGVHKPRLYGSLGGYTDFYVFNVSDTTSIHWKDFYLGYEFNTEQIPDIFYADYLDEVIDVNNNEIQWATNYYLTINDTLLLLMKKDYTMLERFKEYYLK